VEKTIIPNFFVVGAGKSGTTSLYYYLEQHPDIFIPRMKELNFFSSEEMKAQRIYYRPVYIIDRLDDYLELFNKVKSEYAIGDISPSYLFRASAANNIFNFNDKAKIVIILRNPVERAFSDYLMDLGARHFEYAFEDIVYRRVNNLMECIYFQIIERGLYFEQVKRYLDLFGKDNVRIFLFDELKADTPQVLLSIFEFLGVDPSVEINTRMKINPFKRAKKLVKFAYYHQGIRYFAGRMISYRLKDILIKIFFDTRKPQLSYDTREYLKNFYREDILHLQELIGRSLEHWL